MQQKPIFNPIVPLLIGASLAIGQMACKPPSDTGGHSHSHGHGHGHGNTADPEDEAVRLTLSAWTNGFEVFVDHVPPVAGEPAEFVTHISELATGRPRPGGSIKLQMTDSEGATFEHPQGSPVQAGVYVPKITFPKAGDWLISARIPGAAGVAVVPLGKVEVYAESSAADNAKPEAGPDGISFLKERQWDYPIRVLRVGRRDVIETLSVAGEVHLPAGSRGAVVTPIAGRLLGPETGSRPGLGQTLKQGDVVGRIQPVFSEISSRLVEVKAAVERSKIQLADVRRTFDRVAKLAAGGAKSAKDLQAAEKELRLAENDLVAAESLEQAYVAANSDYLSGNDTKAMTVDLVAPVAGIVSGLASIATGEFVAEATSILRTIDPVTVQIHAFVPESQSGRLASVSGADVVMPGRSNNWIRVFDHDLGRLVAVGAEVNHENLTVPVHIATPNVDGRFRVGQQVTVQLHVGRRANALVVPVSAVIEESGLKTVYIQLEGEKFAKRAVETGLRDGEWVELLSGVAEGELVVVENAYAVRLASVSGSALPHAHH